MLHFNLYAKFLFAALELCEKNCSHIIECKNRTGDEMVCKCQVGFTGTHCDTNINDCAPGSCVRGKCIDDINSFRCECPKGFWGSRCEQAINDEKGKYVARLSLVYHIITQVILPSFYFAF